MKRLKWFSGLLVMVLVLGFMNVGGAAAQIPTPALYVIDETGGDCDLIGDWGTDTVWEGRDVCFLTQDVYGSVQIDGSGLGLDGNGYRIIGPPPDNVEDGFGVYFQASDVVLQHLDVSGFFVGIYSSGSQGMRVLNSLIHDNYIGIGTLNSTDVVAFNKTVVNNYYGFFVQEPVEGDEKFGLVGFSNIVANNAVGVYVRDDPGNSSNNGPLVALIYNVFWNNGGGGDYDGYPLSPVFVFNILQDPLFVDPTTGDYRLQADSLAIDTGVELFEGLASVSTDLDLNPRLVDGDGDETPVVDIGAYEYQPPTNTAPTIDAITASPDPVNVNDQPTVEVAFSDPDAGGSHDVTFDWGDGSSDTLSGAASPATASHPYDEAGVYEVTVTVTDAAGESDSATYQYIVVYDPDGGFVTGGGWIDSPAGAYVSNSDAEGKATFGFVSKYKKGATLPSGNTQFQFKAGDLNFISDSYDWLVVTGSNYAKFKGTGTINGAGTYKFQIWAGDNSPDTFRIKIWTEEGEVETVVYDNGMDQAIGGGSIVVHTK